MLSDDEETNLPRHNQRKIQCCMLSFVCLLSNFCQLAVGKLSSSPHLGSPARSNTPTPHVGTSMPLHHFRNGKTISNTKTFRTLPKTLCRALQEALATATLPATKTSTSFAITRLFVQTIVHSIQFALENRNRIHQNGKIVILPFEGFFTVSSWQKFQFSFVTKCRWKIYFYNMKILFLWNLTNRHATQGQKSVHKNFKSQPLANFSQFGKSFFRNEIAFLTSPLRLTP